MPDRAYVLRHRRVRIARGPAKDQWCISCEFRAQEWATKKGTDGRLPEDYQPMCCSCHQKYDGKWKEGERQAVGRSSSERWADPAYKARVSAAVSGGKLKSGYSHSEETRAKLRGKRTPEQIARIRMGRWGR